MKRLSGEVEEGSVSLRLRFKQLGIAGKSQEDIFRLDHTGMIRAESVKTIYYVAAPEGSSSAFGVPMTIEAVWECLEEGIIGLLDFQIQLEAACCSKS